MKTSLLNGFAFITLISLLGSGSVIAEDNCTGTYKDVPASTETIEGPNGSKITFFSNRGMVSSGDSAYNGSGGCSGIMYQMADGKGWASGSCAQLTTSGDNWSYTFFEDLAENGKGTWQGVAGTGKHANNAQSAGWYTAVNMSDKGSDGKWGGSCAK
jgi:hypothetical protein